MIESKASKASKVWETNPLSSSETMSVGGDSGYLSYTHSRSQSMCTTSTIGLFNETEVEQDLEDDIGLIMKPASRKDLINRFDALEEGEELEEDEGVVCEDKTQSSSIVSRVARQPVKVIRSSLKGYGNLHLCYSILSAHWYIYSFAA